jgi:Tat protein secretion system quality control protein TatD with DNase activity
MAAYCDAHSHAHNCAPGWWAAAGGGAALQRVVVCGTSEADWERVAAAAALEARVVPAFGVHPWWAGTVATPAALDRAIDRLRGLLADAALRARGAHVGEIGLDRSPRGLASSGGWEAQAAAFAAQLALAAELGLGVSVHCVRAHDDLLAALAPYAAATAAASSEGGGAPSPPRTALRGVLLHSWAGPPHVTAQLQRMFPRGGATALAFSFQGAAVVAPVARAWWLQAGVEPPEQRPLPSGGAGKQTMSVLAQLPPECVLLETDAPDQGYGRSSAPATTATAAAAAAKSAATDGSCCDVVAEGHDAAGTDLVAHVAFERACASLFGDGSGGSSADGGGTEARPLPHTPPRVVPVYWAAALWRAAKRAGAGASGGGGGVPPSELAAAAAAVEGTMRLRTGGPHGAPVAVTAAAARAELAALQAAASASLAALFGGGAGGGGA